MIEFGNAANNKFVIYPFPRPELEAINPKIRPINIKNTQKLSNAAQIKNAGAISQYCDKWPWIREYNPTRVTILIGHDISFEEMFYTHDFYDKLNKEGFEFITNSIQFNNILTAFWLQNA